MGVQRTTGLETQIGAAAGAHLRLKAAVGVAALLLGGLAACSVAPPSAVEDAASASAVSVSRVPSAPTRTAENFRLIDHEGASHELRRLHDASAVVIVSQVNGDATSRAAARALEGLKAAHPRAEFFLLNSSLADDRRAIAEEAKAQGFRFPVLDDRIQLVGESLGVVRAGEAFVIEPKTWRIVYQGPAAGAGGADEALKSALSAVVRGAATEPQRLASAGPAVDFPERERSAAHAAISYTKTIAPILEAKCVVCHQQGGVGPFAMDNYEIVKGFAPMIREALRTQSMPPWHPDPEVGTFKVDHGLSDADRRTLVHWIEAGAPRGEGEDPLKAVRHVAPEWPLGEPDLVLNIPSFNLPASGVVDYKYPTAANPLTKARWVKAATLAPGDRRGVHHILAGYMSNPSRAGGRTTMAWESSYGEYAVGGESFTVPDGVGILLPAGGEMGFQLHYTPYGKASVDSSRMGLYFYPEGEEPTTMMRHFVIADPYIELPPNTDRHKEVAYVKFPKEAVLHSVFLHTHYRGQAARFDMVHPDGRTETLVNVPRYDFNWQRTYDFAEPVTVPPGAKLVATYWYDNSVRNPGNPDPSEKVIWGDQSWEEMHYTSIYYRWTDETVAKPVDATPQLNQTRMLGVLDDNLNEKIERAELRGQIADRLKGRFDQLDADGDGALSGPELRAAASFLPRLTRGGENDATGAASGGG